MDQDDAYVRADAENQAMEMQPMVNLTQGDLVVVNKVEFQTIGRPCQIDSCGRNAIKVCDMQNVYKFSPCGKAMCENHIEIESHWHDGLKDNNPHEILDKYHCTGEPCCSNFKAGSAAGAT